MQYAVSNTDKTLRANRIFCFALSYLPEKDVA